MSRIRRFLALSRADRLLVLEAAAVLAIVVLGLRLVHVQRLERFLAGISSHLRTRNSGAPPEGRVRDRVGWAVRATASALPGSACLAQSLAVQALLRRRGDSVVMCIGVARNAPGNLAAHAWLETEDSVAVFDPEDRTRYTPLGFRDGRSSQVSSRAGL